MLEERERTKMELDGEDLKKVSGGTYNGDDYYVYCDMCGVIGVYGSADEAENAVNAHIASRNCERDWVKMEHRGA